MWGGGEERGEGMCEREKERERHTHRERILHVYHSLLI